MGMEVDAESGAITQTPGLADALSLLCLTRDDVNYLLTTYKYLTALKPPVENGWVLPEDACSLLEGAVLLLREPLHARCIATTGTSDQGEWWACMDDGSTVLPHDVCEQEVNDMDAVTLDALGAELRAALHRGCRQPITLTQSVAVVERIIQLNHCGEPVRRLWDLRQEAAQLQERLLRRALCRTPAADENHCGSEGGDGGGDGGGAYPATSLVALLDEGLGLAAQIAFTLRERLSDEERRQVEGMLRGFCEGEEEEAAAAAAAASDRGKEQVAAGEVGDAATPTATVGTAAAWSGVAGPTGAGDRTPAVAMDTDDLPLTPATAVCPHAACRPAVSAVPASPERASDQAAPADLDRGASADAAAAPPTLHSVIPEAAALPLLPEAAPPPLPEAAPEASHTEPHPPAASAPLAPPSSVAGSRLEPDGSGPYGASQGAQPARRWGCGRAAGGGGAGNVAGGGGAGRWPPPPATQQGPSGTVGPLDTHSSKPEPAPTAVVSLELHPIGTAHPAAVNAAARHHSGAPYSFAQGCTRAPYSFAQGCTSAPPASDANGGGGGGGSHAAVDAQATTSGQRASSPSPACNSAPGSAACQNAAAAAAGATAGQQRVPGPTRRHSGASDRGRGSSGTSSGTGSRDGGGRKSAGSSPEEGQVGSRSRSRSRSRSAEDTRRASREPHVAAPRRRSRSRSRERQRAQPRSGSSRPEPPPPRPPPGRSGLSPDEVQRLRQAVLSHVASMERAGKSLDLSGVGMAVDLRHRLMDERLKLSQFVLCYMRAEFTVVKDNCRALLVPRR